MDRLPRAAPGPGSRPSCGSRSSSSPSRAVSFLWALGRQGRQGPPGGAVEHATIFPQHVGRLKEAYFRERRGQLMALASDILNLVSDEESTDSVTDEESARKALESLCSRYGYEESTVRVALAELMKARPATA